MRDLEYGTDDIHRVQTANRLSNSLGQSYLLLIGRLNPKINEESFGEGTE
jgi:hypothetical protein